MKVINALASVPISMISFAPDKWILRPVNRRSKYWQNLKKSIKVSGLFMPITLLLNNKKLILVDGHARLDVCKFLGHESIQAYIQIRVT